MCRNYYTHRVHFSTHKVPYGLARRNEFVLAEVSKTSSRSSCRAILTRPWAAERG